MTEKEHEPTHVRVTNKRVLDPDKDNASDVSAMPNEHVAQEPSDDTARELEEARAQAASYLEDLQRLKAEFENYRKRMVKEQTALVERASSAIVERLLPILDNFELALLAADRTQDYESMVRGVE